MQIKTAQLTIIIIVGRRRQHQTVSRLSRKTNLRGNTMLILSEEDAAAFDARLRQAWDTGNICDLVTPNGKRFGECTVGDIRELAEAYEQLGIGHRAKAVVLRDQLEQSLRPSTRRTRGARGTRRLPSEQAAQRAAAAAAELWLRPPP